MNGADMNETNGNHYGSVPADAPPKTDHVQVDYRSDYPDPDCNRTRHLHSGNRKHSLPVNQRDVRNHMGNSRRSSRYYSPSKKAVKMVERRHGYKHGHKHGLRQLRHNNHRLAARPIVRQPKHRGRRCQ